MAETLTLPRLSGPRHSRASDIAPERSPGLLSRLVTAIMTERQRQADRHIARFIERNGGAITDAVEHGIQDRILSPDRRF